MIPIYFINLNSSLARREWFETQVKGLGLSATRIKAYDGKELSESELKKYNSGRTNKPPMGPAEIGNYLSHHRVWRIIQDGNHPWAFIAEDDLHLASNSKPFFVNSKWIPRSADIVKAETTFRKCIRKDISASYAGRSIQQLLSSHGGTGGYFVSKTATTLLVEAMARHTCDFTDHILFSPNHEVFGKLRVFQIDPTISLQHIFFSGKIPGFEKSNLENDRNRRGETNMLYRLQREIVRPCYRIKSYLENAVQARKMDATYSRVKYYDTHEMSSR